MVSPSMRALVAGLGLCSACAGPVLELDLTRTADPTQVELTVLARDGADLPGRGTVHLHIHHPTPTSASLPLDTSGSAFLLLDCETACDTVRATATWQAVQASLEERLAPVSVSRSVASDEAPASTSGFATQVPSPRSPSTTSSPTPWGSGYFGGGEVQLTLEVVDQSGDTTASHVTLESNGRRQALRARADGLVTFFDVPAGPAVVTAGTTKAEPCVPGQPCISGWRGAQTPIVVGPARSMRLKVASGW